MGRWSEQQVRVNRNGERQLMKFYIPEGWELNQSRMESWGRVLAADEKWPADPPKAPAPPPPRSSDPSELLKMDKLTPEEQDILRGSVQQWAKNNP